MVSKGVWGPAIWYLFHTLSFKIKAVHFHEIKDELLGHFISICNNLPCPECTEHAQQEIKHLDKSNSVGFYIKSLGDDKHLLKSQNTNSTYEVPHGRFPVFKKIDNSKQK